MIVHDRCRYSHYTNVNETHFFHNIICISYTNFRIEIGFSSKMSVNVEAVDKTTERTANVSAAYVDENKWTVCHPQFLFQFLFERPVVLTLTYFQPFFDGCIPQLLQIRPCFLYKEEYSDCKSMKGRFHQYFIHGESVDCLQWKRDYDNCTRFEEKSDLKAAHAIIQSEQDRRTARFKGKTRKVLRSSVVFIDKTWHFQQISITTCGRKGRHRRRTGKKLCPNGYRNGTKIRCWMWNHDKRKVTTYSWSVNDIFVQ